MAQLITKGSLRKINQGASAESFDRPPVVQIMEIKAMSSASGGPVRYRAIFNDGDDVVIGILTSALGELVQNSDILENSVVQITNFNVNASGANK